jgi:phage-related protein
MHFSFDGIRSEQMGVQLIELSDGFFVEHFLGDREIIKESIPGNDTSYIFGYKSEPLRLQLTISPLEGILTTEKRRELARWLDCGKFAEFYTIKDINKRYFLMYVGSSNLYRTFNDQGYITINFENISPFTYSPAMEEIFDFSVITSPTIFQVENMGDNDVFPEMWIEKVGKGSLTITNLSDGGRVFRFNELEDGEIVHINTEHRHIKTSLANTYRYSSFNGNYLKFIYGVNRLQVEGKCRIKLKYRFSFRG